VKAAELGRLYVPSDNDGHPLEERVGRHCSSLGLLFSSMEYVGDGEPVVVEGIPTFCELMANGVGYYLNPAP